MKDPKAMERLKAGRELMAKHTFWDSQPVPHPQLSSTQEYLEGEIVPKDIDKVRPTAYQLPEGFEWATMDLQNEKEATEVCCGV